MKAYLCLFLLGLFVILNSFQGRLSAQESSGGEEDTLNENSESVAVAPADTSKWKEEQTQFLQILARDIESHLPKTDVEKLHRNTQRLGSYRLAWAKSSEDLLIANAPVAELILHRYSLYQNPRLTRKILETLLSFENLRYPRASLAFAEVIGLNPELKIRTLDLLAKALVQDSTLAPDVLLLLESSFGEDIPRREKLFMIKKSCSAWRGVVFPPAPENADADDFWLRLLEREAQACQRGL